MGQGTKSDSTSSLKEKLNLNEPEGAETLTEQENEEGFATSSAEELQKKLTAAEQKAAESWDRLLRLQAEMDNMQRRAERDITNAHKYGLEKFTLELLPIIDGLERAVLAHTDEESGADSLLAGVKLTLKMLYTALEKFGIQQVDPASAAFNPELHQAVSTQVDATVKPGTVLTVLQKGYLLNNRLVRPALVVVAKN